MSRSILHTPRLPLWTLQEECQAIRRYQQATRDWWAMVFAQTTYVQRTTAWTHPLMAPPSYVEDTPEAWAVADRHLGTLRILDAAVQEPRTQIPQQIHRAVEEEAFRRNLGYLQLMCGRRALRAHNVGIDQEDLLVEGFLSVRNALQGFDLSKGTRFITYLGWWIRQGAILAMRKADFVARSSGTMDLARHVYDIQRRYGVLYNRYPTEEEIRVELAKLPIKKYQTSVISREVLESVLTLRVSLTLDAPLKTDQGDISAMSFLDSLPAPTTEESSWSSHEESARIHAVRMLIDHLPLREQDIVRRRFPLEEKEPEPLQSIGESHGLTRERVRQIESRLLRYFLVNLRGLNDEELLDLKAPRTSYSKTSASPTRPGNEPIAA